MSLYSGNFEFTVKFNPEHFPGHLLPEIAELAVSTDFSKSPLMKELFENVISIREELFPEYHKFIRVRDYPIFRDMSYEFSIYGTTQFSNINVKSNQLFLEEVTHSLYSCLKRNHYSICNIIASFMKQPAFKQLLEHTNNLPPQKNT